MFVSAEVLITEEDTTSLRVFRAGFVPSLVDDAVTVTRLDKAITDLLPQDSDLYKHGGPCYDDVDCDEDDDCDADDDDCDADDDDCDADDDDCDADDDDDDNSDDDNHIFVAQHTTAGNSLFNSVSYALTGRLYS